MAWASLGWLYFHESEVGIGYNADADREAALTSAMACATKALELDPSCADAYALSGLCYLSKREYDEAIAMSEKAIALAPNHAENLATTAAALNKSGQPERSFEMIKKAMRLCPIYPGWYLYIFATACRLLGRNESAVNAFEEGIKRNSDNLVLHVGLASTLGELGGKEDAKKPVSEILRLDAKFSIEKYMTGLSYRDPAELARFADGLREAGLPKQEAENPPLPDGPSVAVLPFENASDDPGQSYFSDGLTENIIAGLTRFREILVIGVKSILIAREQTADVREIGRALGVAHIVDGSVRKAGERVRVTAQLIDAATGQRLWAQHYDRDLDDIFAVEDEITNIIVATVAGQIEQLELRRAANQSAEHPVAYDYVLRGRQCLNRYTKDGELEARRHFERALELDPEYAAAHAGLSISFMHEFAATWSEAPEEALDRSYSLAQKAVALDDADSPARYAIAGACFHRGQHELAMVHIEKALELNPNDYHNICAKAWILVFSDHPSEAVECSLEAMRLNPLVPDNCLYTIGMTEYGAGRYEEALAAFGKVKGWGLHRPAWIAACYAQLGRDAQAHAAAAEVRELTPSDPSTPDEDDIEGWCAYWSRFGEFEDPNDQARFLDGLRKAGLPA